MYLFFYQGPFFTYALVEEEGKITRMLFEQDPLPEEAIVKETVSMKEMQVQLDAYFKGKHSALSFPDFEGKEHLLNIFPCKAEVATDI